MFAALRAELLLGLAYSDRLPETVTYTQAWAPLQQLLGGRLRAR